MEVSNLFGKSDLGTRTDVCDVHGNFIAHGILLKGEERWHGCPTCSNIKIAAQEADARRQEEIDRRARTMQRLIGRTAIPQRFVSKRFDNYTASNDGQIKALATVQEYADSFEKRLDDGASLILCGKPGTGKTHLACAVANQILETHYPLFSRVFDAVRTIKATWARNSEQTETQAIQSFIKPDLLILDEVGMQFGSDAEMLLLFEIINGRYEAVKPTIILSNLPIGELKTFLGDRVMDRLREGGGKYIAFDWESQRGKI